MYQPSGKELLYWISMSVVHITLMSSFVFTLSFHIDVWGKIWELCV